MFLRILSILVLVVLTACSGERSLRCEDVLRYAASQTVAPVRVPDGLDVPDESQAFRIPAGEPLEVPTAEEMTECLESPPDFFDDSQQ